MNIFVDLLNAGLVLSSRMRIGAGGRPSATRSPSSTPLRVHTQAPSESASLSQALHSMRGSRLSFALIPEETFMPEPGSFAETSAPGGPVKPCCNGSSLDKLRTMPALGGSSRPNSYAEEVALGERFRRAWKRSQAQTIRKRPAPTLRGSHDGIES